MHSLESKNNEKKLPLDYNDLIILYFLSRQKKSRNITEISAETEVYYQTVTEKIKKLKSYQLINTIQKGRSKLVKITEKGKNHIQNWAQTAFGKALQDEFEDTLKLKK